MESLAFLFIVFVSIIGFFLFMYFVPVGLWITAIFAGVKITIGELIGMRIRKVPPGIIVNSLITATKAGRRGNAFQVRGSLPAGQPWWQ